MFRLLVEKLAQSIRYVKRELFPPTARHVQPVQPLAGHFRQIEALLKWFVIIFGLAHFSFPEGVLF
jgi:hypothetical protein